MAVYNLSVKALSKAVQWLNMSTTALSRDMP